MQSKTKKTLAIGGGVVVIGGAAAWILTRPSSNTGSSPGTSGSSGSGSGSGSAGSGATSTSSPGPSGARTSVGYVDGLGVALNGSNGIIITWDKASGATTYKVQLDNHTVATTRATTYTIKNLTAGKTYSVEVIPGTSAEYVDNRLAGQTILVPTAYNPTTKTATYTSSSGQPVYVDTTTASGSSFNPPQQWLIDELAALDAKTDYSPGTSATVGYYDPFANTVSTVPPGGFSYSAVSGRGFTQAEYNAVMAGITQQQYVSQFGGTTND